MPQREKMSVHHNRTQPMWKFSAYSAAFPSALSAKDFPVTRNGTSPSKSTLNPKPTEKLCLNFNKTLLISSVALDTFIPDMHLVRCPSHRIINWMVN